MNKYVGHPKKAKRPLASGVQTARMNPFTFLPPKGMIMVVNHKPKRRWQTAIKAREQQLVRLAEEALRPKEQRTVFYFLDYKDMDLVA